MVGSDQPVMEMFWLMHYHGAQGMGCVLGTNGC